MERPVDTHPPVPRPAGEQGPANQGSGTASRSPRLDLLKALGDNTRYAIYLELARSPLPLATAEVADALDLHVNTVRPHLERMRDVGLLTVDTETRGTVGRPQHRWSISADAPALGLEPSPWPTMARTLLEAAALGGLGPEDIADAGRRQGRADAAQWPDDTELPRRPGGGAGPPRASTPPPWRTPTGPPWPSPTARSASSPSNTRSWCAALHGGLVEGFVDAFPGCAVDRFHTLVDRSPCQVDLVLTAADPEPT